MSEICKCGHEKRCHHDGTGIWAKGCNQPLAMELGCPCTSFTARPDEPKGDKPWTCPKCIDAAGEISNLIESNSELSRQLQDERQRMCRELIAIRHDESRHVAGNYYENWTAGRWRAVNEWIAKEFASELAQDSSRTGDPGADLSADHPESSE